MLGHHPYLDLFFQSYVDAALFASTDEKGRPLDRSPYGASKITADSLERMEQDCAAFFAENNLNELSNTEIMRAGHDFWLTRNNHGAGFWDGDWPEPQAHFLTAASHLFGPCDLYVGDNGWLHASTTERKGVLDMKRN